jgi:hypothetical protein
MYDDLHRIMLQDADAAGSAAFDARRAAPQGGGGTSQHSLLASAAAIWRSLAHAKADFQEGQAAAEQGSTVVNAGA